MAKNYYPASLFSMVYKISEKHVNNKLVDHHKKCGIFFWFSVWFQVFCKCTDVFYVSVVFDRISRTFNRSVATRAVGLDLIYSGLSR